VYVLDFLYFRRYSKRLHSIPKDVVVLTSRYGSDLQKAQSRFPAALVPLRQSSPLHRR
jgi:hypothetical protein